MNNTHNHDESPGWEWESFAITCFVVIAISTFVGLIALPKKEGEKLTLSFWALTIPFTLSFSAVGCWLSEPREGCSDQDEKPDCLTGSSEEGRGSRANDVHVHTHVVLDASIDERLASVTKDLDRLTRQVRVIDEFIDGQARVNTASLAEQERQAKNNMLAMLRDLGTDSDPLEVLQNGVRICLDVQLWIEPAKEETRYSDTERFYSEEKIYPGIRDSRIIWSLCPDYDPPEDQIVGNDELDTEQTAFRPFRCCSRCKYIGKYYDCCAVVPFGCTGDPSEQCREFVSQDSDAHVYLSENRSIEANQLVDNPILDQLSKIIAAFGQSTEGDDGMSAMYQDSRYLFLQNDYEINVFRHHDAQLPDHIYRARSRSSHQDIRGVGHNYFFDHTTAEDRAHFTRLAESIADRAQKDAEPEMNPVV